MVVNGRLTRKITRVIETLCGTSVSQSSVSGICKDLDQEITAFCSRPIEGNHLFLIIDATYFKVRKNNRATSKALIDFLWN